MIRAILLILFLALTAQANVLSEADSLFHAGDYDRVELLALRAEQSNDLPDSERVALELLGGYSLIMLGREDDARVHFTHALELDSTLTLDPVVVSPKFRVVFDELKRDWLASRATEVSPDDPTRKVTDQGTRIESVRRSATRPARLSAVRLNFLCPGAGFVREGRVARGLLHAGVTVVLTGLWLSEISQNNSSREDYLAAATTAEAERLYDDYNAHHRQMWTFGLAAAGAYALSQLDLALWRGPATLTAGPSGHGLKLALAF
ncbi:MAG: hypothetical protein IPH10_05725 [bacterium]|nr:hypothetical protein [bacterium]